MRGSNVEKICKELVGKGTEKAQSDRRRDGENQGREGTGKTTAGKCNSGPTGSRGMQPVTFCTGQSSVGRPRHSPRHMPHPLPFPRLLGNPTECP